MKPGDLDDPVAQNIRREQQRDAMPSPEEAARERERFFDDKACAFCDEIDNEKLRLVNYGYHQCPAYQAPPAPERIITCEDCGFDADVYGTWTTVAWMRGRDQAYAGFVTYECRMTEHAEIPEPDREQIKVGEDEVGEPVYEDGPPQRPEQPSVPFTCRCGANVAFIVTLPPEDDAADDPPRDPRFDGGFAGP